MDSDGSGSSGSFKWGHTMTSHDSDSSDSAMGTENRNNTVKEEVNANVSNQNNEKNSNKRKRKISSISELSDSERLIPSPKKKKIKQEDPEDTLTSKKKSKKKDKNNITETIEHTEVDICDEDELNMKVKQEEDANEILNVTKSKKKKKREDIDTHSSINDLDITLTQTESKRKKSKSKKSSDFDNTYADYDYLNEKVIQENNNSDTPNVSKSKKNKRRDRNESQNHSSMYNEGDSNLGNNDEESVELNGDKKYNDIETDSVLCIEQKYEIDVKDETDTEYEYLNKKVKEEKELNDSFKSQTSYNKLDITSDKVKKEKKRKSKSSPTKNGDERDEVEFEIEDKFCAEETIVQKSMSKHKRTKLNYTDYETNEEQQDHRLNSYTENNISDLTLQEDDKDEIIGTTESIGHRKSSTKSAMKSITSTPKISERIMFEEDIDINKIVAKNSFKKLSSFLREKPTLQPVTQKLEKEQKITEDDEIWIVKCPRDLDIVNFKDKDITIDHKSKMKINGETYNGTLNETVASATVMSGDVIKNVKINGVVTFKRRLPKPQFVEDNVMINDQTDFIPLPETKCRHPLFGSDYEKSIQMPMSVVQRLKDHQNGSSTERKKKKHKKEHINDDSPDNELESEIPRKKSKKRKLSSDVTVKKAKRIKKELDSSDVWESEKAIEENLFNF